MKPTAAVYITMVPDHSAVPPLAVVGLTPEMLRASFSGSLHTDKRSPVEKVTLPFGKQFVLKVPATGGCENPPNSARLWPPPAAIAATSRMPTGTSLWPSPFTSHARI